MFLRVLAPAILLVAPAVAGASAPASDPHVEAEARLCGREGHFGGVPDADTLDVVLTRVLDAAKASELGCTACRRQQAREREVHGDTQVRLGGGLDAPEASTAAGRQARDFVRGLLRDAGTLYLDVDDGALRGCERHHHAGRDVHCRLLAIVWVRRAGEWVNVNEALLAWGRKKLPDHPWLRYARHPSEFELGEARPPAAEQDPVVWVTRSGTRYHREGCASLLRSRRPLPRSEALRRGLSACAACAPP